MNTRHVRLDEKQPYTKLVLSLPAHVDVADLMRRYNEDAEKNGLPKIVSAEKRDETTHPPR
jgi:hypothetical protein